jgi:hypothetical protein
MKRILCASLVGLSLGLCGCDESSAVRLAKSEATLLKSQNEFLTENLAKVANEAKAAQRALEAVRAEQSSKETEIRQAHESLKKQLNEVQKSFDQYKEKFRVSARTKAPGLRLPVLACGEEEIYKDVEVLAINPGELKFRHSAGLGKMPLGRLEQALRDRFAYDPEEANAWLASERKKEVDAEVALQERVMPAGTGTGATSAGRSREGFNPGQSKGKADPQKRLNYVARLNKVYASARSLQADNTGCPIHKRYELAALAREANELKQTIASLP